MRLMNIMIDHFLFIALVISALRIRQQRLGTGRVHRGSGPGGGGVCKVPHSHVAQIYVNSGTASMSCQILEMR